MAKFKGKGVVVAGLLAGAASFLSKKENRDKAMDYLNQAKETVNKNGGVQGLMDKVKASATPQNAHTDASNEPYVEETLRDVASTAGHESDIVVDGNQMIDEGGGQSTIDAYNEKQHEKYHS